MKKAIIIILIVCIVAAGGYFAFTKARDYLALKAIEQIVNSYDLSELDDIVPPSSDAAEEQPEAPGGNSPAEGADAPAPEAKKSVWDYELVREVYSRFTMSEITEVSRLMSGGLNAESKARIKEIIYSKVSRDEVTQLLEIYNTYY